MKTIGKANDGNFIVEIGRDEFREISNFMYAVQNVSFEGMYQRGEPYYIDFDFTKPFEVIRAWWISKMKINEMKVLLENMEESLGKVDK